MSQSILITQCLQNDFVKPIGPHDPLPNLLHVGLDEARRLMGEDPAKGPVARVMRWAYELPSDDLKVIHIRDWHDPEDPRQRDHLRQFGPHCLQGTPGAGLILGWDDGAAERPNEHLVDAIALNDFEDTVLPDLMNALIERYG